MADAKTTKPAADKAAADAPADELDYVEEGTFMHWLKDTGRWYLVSMVSHMALFLILALVLGKVYAPEILDSVFSFDEAKITKSDDKEPEVTNFDMAEAPLEPTELTTDTLLDTAPIQQDAQFNDDSDKFVENTAGGTPAGLDNDAKNMGLGQDLKAIGPGPTMKGKGGLSGGKGTGENFGAGGSGTGFGHRGSGSRAGMNGSTKASERAVAAALMWLARHQNYDGSWSLHQFHKNCKGTKCSGAASNQSDAAATAMGLLPFLAAGQTHMSKGPYQKNIAAGLQWLISKQQKNGDLSAGATHTMYTHGLCTIAICEAFGMTNDYKVRIAADAAIKFIESAQNPQDGGWRYRPLDPGDTSVVGWQVMGLKSGQMAGLTVNEKTFEGTKKWLKATSKGDYGGLFSYMAGGAHTPTMSSVGMLCRQYLGASRDDPGLAEGIKYLMANGPENNRRNIYYHYYATQVLHNMEGPDWDKWNRVMRKSLIDTQCKKDCEAGSWDPAKPTTDAWGDAGGRLMITSLSCLTLEVYYRYLPLYKLDKKADLEQKGPLDVGPEKPAAKPPAKTEAKPEAKTEAKTAAKTDAGK